MSSARTRARLKRHEPIARLASDDSDMGLCFLFEGSSGCSLYDERRDGYREKCQTNRTRYAALFLC